MDQIEVKTKKLWPPKDQGPICDFRKYFICETVLLLPCSDRPATVLRVLQCYAGKDVASREGGGQQKREQGQLGGCWPAREGTSDQAGNSTVQFMEILAGE